MENYIVTRAFQHRGGMWRPGQTIRLSAEEAGDRFVREHVRPAGDGEAGKAAPAPNLTNGEAARRGDAPGKVADEADGGRLTAAEMRAALAKAGVPVPPNARRAELDALWENFRQSVAGSPAEANRPRETGV